MNRLIFYVLRGGVLVAAALIVAGLALAAVGGALSDAALRLGILLLILTPVARVFLSIFYFAKEKDRAYVAITAAVFLILMVGVAIGLR